ncbi:unnamed protein product [Prorocentrum cordatum]|uniref:Uncharacterized protein n=1 Tax=Prorocentrum cordatum TaxID=2364126 RepID=A0ABN9TQB6_9DINO|nr:unnamed protein product [Polarella glacialis]
MSSSEYWQERRKRSVRSSSSTDSPDASAASASTRKKQSTTPASWARHARLLPLWARWPGARPLRGPPCAAPPRSAPGRLLRADSELPAGLGSPRLQVPTVFGSVLRALTLEPPSALGGTSASRLQGRNLNT